MSKADQYEYFKLIYVVFEEFGYAIEHGINYNEHFVVRKALPPFGSEYHKIYLQPDYLTFTLADYTYNLSDPNLFDRLKIDFDKIVWHYSYKEFGDPISGRFCNILQSDEE